MGIGAVGGFTWRALAVAVSLLLLLSAPAAVAAVDPYGTHDAGGFRNVLPAGEKGVDNAVDLGLFTANGTLPEHWADQLPLYENLLYASPHLTNAQIPDFFKDATFGVKPNDLGTTTIPKAGVTITRDKAYGVPHIYGNTRADVMFGTGYAGAQDRLFLMDILRHTGKAELSSFAGGTPGDRAMDRTEWQLAPYTDAELTAQANAAPQIYGAEGQQLLDDVNNYIAGINAYINAALLNPTLLPAEYAAFGKVPEQWTVSDVIATASLIGGIFGKGGGAEVQSAKTLRTLIHRFGTRKGRRVWKDFRSANDPEAPTTVSGRFPYETGDPFARRGLALPDPGSVSDAPVAPAVTTRGTSERGGEMDIGKALSRQLSQGTPHASNWELVSARESKTGHPIGVLGPQVGYYVPQILMEEDIHGGGLDARGATFPGVGLYVLLGHGRGYAWSATTATSDNVDTFAEVLCQDDYHYRYKGNCLPMDKLDRNNSWSPNAVTTTSGSETLTAYRTVHGIVYARGTVKGRKVAFVSARSTYFHEADSARFFSRLNNPSAMKDGPLSFRRAAKRMNLAFNWSYLDDKHIAYYLTGDYPQRAPRTSPDFPILGTGAYDWRGFDPVNHTASFLDISQHPHAVDPPYLVSWNNKQAPGWAAADDQFAYGPLARSQMISDRVARGVRGGRKMSLAQLVRAMEEPASEDLRNIKVLPWLLKAVGRPSSPALRHALATLSTWRAHGSHRRDLNKDGTDEYTPAITLMDAWWPKLVAAEFKPTLGQAGYGAVQRLLGVGDPMRGQGPDAPSYFGGWWGYVSKDLRSMFGGRVRGPYSRLYCGRRSRKACRRRLRRSLSAALKVTPAELYGYGDCASTPTPACYDQNRSVIASGIGEPAAFPFQNRPTFQQTVSLTHGAP